MEAKQIEQLDLIAKRLENSGIAEYVKLSQRTGKILWLNLLSGMARGFGFTVGTTLVLAIVAKIISHVINMNIPYLTELLQHIVSMAKGV